MNNLTRMVMDGKIKVMIDRTYPLEKVGEAIQYLADGNVRGKVVVQVKD